MEEIVVYVHGKGGSAQEAEHYKALFPNCEVIGFTISMGSHGGIFRIFYGSAETLREAHTGGK